MIFKLVLGVFRSEICASFHDGGGAIVGVSKFFVCFLEEFEGFKWCLLAKLLGLLVPSELQRRSSVVSSLGLFFPFACRVLSSLVGFVFSVEFVLVVDLLSC